MLPKVQNRDSDKKYINAFGGLDRRYKIADTSLGNMKNMSVDKSPALTVRPSRRLVANVPDATEIFAQEYENGDMNSFTGVRGNHFYYKGTEISGTLTTGKKSIADFNGKICIFPDKKYYDYMYRGAGNAMSTSLESLEKTFTLPNAVFESSYDKSTDTYVTYIATGVRGYKDYFNEGEAITISGCTHPENDTVTMRNKKETISSKAIVSAVIESLEDTRIYLALYNKNGQRVGFYSCSSAREITLKLAIPDMDNICVHNNRLWGTSVDGDYIYASRLGDCRNFNCFQGLADDSWYSRIATGGEFTGICSYRSAVVAFKRNNIHHIYGDAPNNFSIPKQVSGGCIDGRSICEIGGILYYLSDSGFMAYNGGEPYNISPQIDTKYIAGTAGTDGIHYYVSAKKPNNESELLVYLPERNMWAREDETYFDSFCTYKGSVYGVAEGKMWQLNSGNEVVNWCTVSKRFSYDEIKLKAPIALWVRLEMSASTEITVYISRDNADFVECGQIEGKEGFFVRRIPIRYEKCDSFRIMLEGSGKVVIHDMEIESYNGGRIYGE